MIEEAIKMKRDCRKRRTKIRNENSQNHQMIEQEARDGSFF